MATPENFTLTFVGRSGERYPVSGLVSDVAGALATFETSGGLAVAGSSTYFQLPEPCVLIDYAQITGTTVIAGIEIRVSSLSKGIHDKVIHVNTSQARPGLAIKVPYMAIVTAIQR